MRPRVILLSRRRHKAILTGLAGLTSSAGKKDHALFDRELEKVIRALRTVGGGREKPPPTRL